MTQTQHRPGDDSGAGNSTVSQTKANVSPAGWPRRVILAEGRGWTLYGRWLP